MVLACFDGLRLFLVDRTDWWFHRAFMDAAKGDEHKLVYHEGLTELQEMKRTMLQTVCRYCLVGLILAGGIAFVVALVQSRFWFSAQEHLRGHLGL